MVQFLRQRLPDDVIPYILLQSIVLRSWKGRYDTVCGCFVKLSSLPKIVFFCVKKEMRLCFCRGARCRAYLESHDSAVRSLWLAGDTITT